ncbi:MAG TPA: ATP-binding cassette domain-containing protein, partial [Gammaproteobacteria bacterium]|nr:ATP-binding cassette domain-containing protein [Gammaproteobacteria bacterium]
MPTSLHDSAGPPLITLRDCDVVLGGRRVLRELDFTLRRGNRCLLVGANGAGKTLFLKLLRGDIWPTPNGRELRRYQFDGERSEEPLGFKERIAYVGSERQDRYERHGFDLTLEQVVTTGLYDEDIPLTRPTRSERARVRRVLERFDIDRLSARRMLSLSHGQRRLALIARAYVSRPVVLLLDEPFNGLDQICADRLRHSLAQRGGPAAWVLATHRPAEAPGNINRRLSLHEGRLTEPGRARRTRHARAQAHSG